MWTETTRHLAEKEQEASDEGEDTDEDDEDDTRGPERFGA